MENKKTIDIRNKLRYFINFTIFVHLAMYMLCPTKAVLHTLKPNMAGIRAYGQDICLSQTPPT